MCPFRNREQVEELRRDVRMTLDSVGCVCVCVCVCDGSEPAVPERDKRLKHAFIVVK